MTIEATPKNIQWLMEKLYIASREIQATRKGFDPPHHFVLLTKTKEERVKVLDHIWDWAVRTYGIPNVNLPQEQRLDSCDIMSLPSVQSFIVLIDLE